MSCIDIRTPLGVTLSRVIHSLNIPAGFHIILNAVWDLHLALCFGLFENSAGVIVVIDRSAVILPRCFCLRKFS